MTNDDGSGYGDTPTEVPHATLAEHRPYVLVLANVIPPLHAVVTTLVEIMHELCAAREMVGPSTPRRIAVLGGTIEQVGANIRRGFGG